MEIALKQLLEYRHCPYKYYLTYVKKHKSVVSSAKHYMNMCIKKAVANLVVKIENSSNPAMQTVLNTFHKFWGARPNNLTYPKGQNAVKLKHSGERSINYLYGWIQAMLNARRAKIAGIAYPYIFSTGGHLIAGEIDILLSTPGEKWQLIFYNFNRTPPTEKQLEKNLELSSAIYGFRSMFDTKESKVTVFNVPNMVQIPTQREGSEFNRMKQEIQMLIRGIHAQSYWPCANWRCETCPYTKECRSTNILI